MAMFHLLKSRTSIDIFRTEKCKVTFGLKYILFFRSFVVDKHLIDRYQKHDIKILKSMSYELVRKFCKKALREKNL